MRGMLVILAIVGAMAATACGGDKASPTAPAAATGGSTASCNGNPPGQQPSGNPAQAPGNSSSLDKDCKN